MSRALLTIATCLALHPVFHWTLLRAFDGSDEPTNLIALAFVPCWIFYGRRSESLRGPLTIPGLLLVLYVASFGLLTPLPRGLIAMTALTALLSQLYLGRRFVVGLWLVLVLSLPVVASLEFFVSYPLRVLVSEGAASLLRMSGLNVQVKGVSLVLGERAVFVDAPCSGIRMLWAGGFATGVLALVRQLSTMRTVLLALGAGVCLIAGNVLRAAALFHAETRPTPFPPLAHEAVGLSMFGLTLLAIVLAAAQLERGACHA